MPRIKGLNDRVTLKKKAIKPGITVWKGAKKSPKSAGKSLGNKFRIEAPAALRTILKQSYKAEERDGGLFVETLNIVPAYEDEFKTFSSKMAAYTASRPLHFCDRETIHTKFIADSQNYFAPIEANEPCPVAGTNHKCSLGCTRTGDFYFYIWELLLAGSAEFCRLQVHGVEDNQSIAKVLDETKEDIGAIKNSPFVNEETRGNIIYLLSRRSVQSKYPIMEGEKRSQKRGTKENWIINLQLHPIWLNPYNYYQQSKQLQAANYQPSQKLIEQVHGENLIAPAVNINNALPPKDYWQMNLAKAEELQILWREHNWNENALSELLYSYFDFSDRKQIKNMTKEQFEQMKVYLADPQTKAEFLNNPEF